MHLSPQTKNHEDFNGSWVQMTISPQTFRLVLTRHSDAPSLPFR